MGVSSRLATVGLALCVCICVCLCLVGWCVWSSLLILVNNADEPETAGSESLVSGSPEVYINVNSVNEELEGTRVHAVMYG